MEKILPQSRNRFGNKMYLTLQVVHGQVIFANDKDLEHMTQKLQEEYCEWSLEINVQKTKYLHVGPDLINIQLENGAEFTHCEEYTFFGTT